MGVVLTSCSGGYSALVVGVIDIWWQHIGCIGNGS